MLVRIQDWRSSISGERLYDRSIVNTTSRVGNPYRYCRIYKVTRLNLSQETVQRQNERMDCERWKIEMLGGLCVRKGDQVIERFPTRKSASLLVYLALFTGQSHPREVLMERLWPESEPGAARQNLRQALHFLRRLLESVSPSDGSLFLADNTSIRLNSKIVLTDVQQFIGMLQSAKCAGTSGERLSFLQTAVESYRGELLAGYYDEWIFPERVHLEAAYIQALHQIITELEAIDEPLRAVEYALRLISADPYEEEAHCRVIRLYSDAGQSSRAVAQYRELERILNEAFGEQPSLSTQESVRAILQNQRSLKSARALNVPSSVIDVSLPASVSIDGPPKLDNETQSVVALHLPTPLTQFFGRTDEIAALAERLSEPEMRLLTLTGIGGTGKTRLALEVVHQIAPNFENSVFFVPLAALNDARLLLDTIAEVIPLSHENALSKMEQIVKHLASKRTLLVLDTFEAVVVEGAATILSLLQQVPTLTFLVTSRSRLNIEGEYEFPVHPLPIPESIRDKRAINNEALLTSLEASAAVQLFIDRAQAVRPRFRITPQNAPDLAAVCILLEGIPLAIELAAARIRVLSLAQMREQLGHRLDFLVSRRRDLPARHRSLREAIAWSVRLLTPEQQALFRGLAVFPGGCLREMAHAVCRPWLAPNSTDWYAWIDSGMPLPEGNDSNEMLHHLEELLDRSLIYTEESPFGLRFRMLDSLREYARSQWTYDEEADLNERHAYQAYFVVQRSGGNDSLAWQPKVRAELDSIRSALEWMLIHSPKNALHMAGNLSHSLSHFDQDKEAAYWLKRAFAAVKDHAIDPDILFFAHERAFCFTRDESHVSEMVRLTEVQESAAKNSLCHTYLGSIYWYRGDLDQARTYLDTALTYARQINADGSADGQWEEDSHVLQILLKLGQIAWQQGRLEDAERQLHESFSICDMRHYDPPNMCRCSEALGMAAIARTEFIYAIEIFRRTMQLCPEAWGLIPRTITFKLGIALCLLNTSDSRKEGFALIRLGLTGFLEDEDQKDYFTDGFYLLTAFLAAAQGHFDLAAQLLGRSDTAVRLFGVKDSDGLKNFHISCIESTRNTLGETDYTKAYHKGESLTWQQAFILILEYVV